MPAREALLHELRARADAARLEVPEGTTLLGLEPRLRRLAGSASARYAAALRLSRYDPSSPEPPDLSERRAVRRELAGPKGVRGRLLAPDRAAPRRPARPLTL